MAYLECVNLSKKYPHRAAPAISDVSLSVTAGEMLALLGPSGSGKSTVLKLIAGIVRPDSGDILLAGRSLLDVRPNRRGAILMFQKAYLFPFLSISENIAFGLKVKGVRRQTIREKVAKMLTLVELPGIERRMPAELSGGEQQRVALARALVTEPKVLLLDEPLSSLDSAVRQTLQRAIRRIQGELGTTMMLVTHDLTEAVAMSDRTALLLDGRVVACDQPGELFERPPTVAAARFMGCTTFLRGQLEDGQLVGDGWQLAVTAESGVSRPATLTIRPENLRLHDTPAANALRGVVSERTYRGEFCDVEVRLAGQVVQVRHYGTGLSYALGTAVHVQFPPEQLFEVREG
jgi:ABC-type Fe3+/spermidine/putrescine transport system ATPase subunit